MGKLWIHSAASNTSKGELDKDEPLESSSRNSLQNSCPANGDFKTLKQKWRPVSGGTVSLKDIASASGEVNRNEDDASQILFKMQGGPSFIATSASNGEVKNGETLESSRCNDSHNYYEVNGDFVAPKQIWRQVSAASNTSNGELKMNEPLESSSSNSSQNSCPANGDLRTIKQKWRAVSGGTVYLEDIASSYCEAKGNVGLAGEILFNMQGDPSFNATSASNSEVKNRETSESSRSNHSQNYYRVSADFVAPKQIWRQVSAASKTSNGELKKDEPLESSSSNSFQSSCPTNGDLRTIKQKWRPVSGGTVSLNDIASSCCEVKPNADVAGEIQFKMLGDPSFIATNASNGEAKNGEALESSYASNSQNYSRVNVDFVAPKQVWRQVSAASNTCNGERKKDNPLESSSSNSSQNSCPENGDLITIKQKWRPVSGGTVSLNDIASSYCEVNRNVDVGGEILFKMQGGPSCIATSASNGEEKNAETLESSHANSSQNYYKVNGDFVAPKQIWRQVSAASNTSNGELKKNEPLEPSSSNSLQNSCPASGEILFKMQGPPSFIASNASNGEAKNVGTLESSCANNSQNHKQIWRQVSGASNTSNGELKKDEPLESSGSNSLQNSCPENGDLRTLNKKWRPVSGGPIALKDIASAFCEANRNVDVAGEILFKMQGEPSFISSSASNGEVKNGETKKDEPLESLNSNSLQNSCPANGNLRTLKQKWRPVSRGTVSNMLGKGYMKSAPSTNGSNPRTKPLKVDPKEWPVSVPWGENKSNSLKEDRLHKDMEDFLFKMLGVAFQLGRNVISDVLDNCGYDMQKSMEKLLDLSAAGLDERSKFLGESNKKTNDTHPRAEEPSCENRNEVFEYQWRSKTTNGQKRDPKGELVEGTLVDSVVMAKVDTVGSQENKKDDEDEEDSFQALRRAVEEYRGTMKEYFKAATEAFAKGDQDLANRLVEQGQFYRGKARQADEESNQKIFDTWNTDAEYEMLLDLHDHGAREAMCLLKCHLSSLAGIPSFKYLKVIVDKNEEEASNGNCQRLVRMSILWFRSRRDTIHLRSYEAIGEGINHLE
ncbi:hypothetical protein V6N11_063767 [Hibiscus sabdariffa]|uniref:DUF1771 domain-containing protein n=1 Tax=Hibiscus sabdariffa TaxID=183260 RepID=A0ABR2PLP9_9ROSI